MPVCCFSPSSLDFAPPPTPTPRSCLFACSPLLQLQASRHFSSSPFIRAPMLPAAPPSPQSFFPVSLTSSPLYVLLCQDPSCEPLSWLFFPYGKHFCGGLRRNINMTGGRAHSTVLFSLKLWNDFRDVGYPAIVKPIDSPEVWNHPPPPPPPQLFPPSFRSNSVLSVNFFHVALCHCSVCFHPTRPQALPSSQLSVHCPAMTNSQTNSITAMQHLLPAPPVLPPVRLLTVNSNLRKHSFMKLHPIPVWFGRLVSDF